ncbi:MAG: four helix bundle protein [Nitrospirae bacterium]|nr:four helix bundle protein [Nitrospirota bacterium]
MEGTSLDKIRTHKDLEVWKKAMKLTESLYKITSHFPKEEQYGLISQIRRAAVSIPSNIAEGAARNSNKEFIQYLYISLGSLSELETQLLLAQRLNFLNDSNQLEDIDSVRKMTVGLIHHLKRRKMT